MADDYTVRNAREYETGVTEYEAFNADRSAIAPYLDALCERTVEGGRVLDLGCGPGWDCGLLQRRVFVAVGFDLSHGHVEHARRNHPAFGYVQGDMRELPFAESEFDGVWACASMVHLASADIDGALYEVARVLARGGAFVGSVQIGDQEAFVARKSAPGHQLFYAYRSPEDWRTRVEAAGFSLDELVAEVSEEEKTHLNEGARGWATVIARRD